MNVQRLIHNAFGDEIWITIPVIAIIGILLWYYLTRKPNKGEAIKKSLYDKEGFWLVLIIVFLPVLSFFLYFTYHFYYFWVSQPQNIDFFGWLMLAIPGIIVSVLTICFSLLKINRLRSQL